MRAISQPFAPCVGARIAQRQVLASADQPSRPDRRAVLAGQLTQSRLLDSLRPWPNDILAVEVFALVLF